MISSDQWRQDHCRARARRSVQAAQSAKRPRAEGGSLTERSAAHACSATFIDAARLHQTDAEAM